MLPTLCHSFVPVGFMQMNMETSKKQNAKSLISQISEAQFLNLAWSSLNKSKKNSRGVNEETIEVFQNSLVTNLVEISKQLSSGKYKFSPVRGVVIEKKEKGKYRPLRIADVRDRLVCKAIALKLDEYLTTAFNLDNPASFAYRPNRGVYEAMKVIVDNYNDGYQVILEADIKKFFDTVNRPLLLEKVYATLPDSSLNDLISEGLSQEVANLADPHLSEYAHYFHDFSGGIPQGNALSPLFANVYLADFDYKILQQGYRLVRYADDFVIMCKKKKDAEEAYNLAKTILEEELHLSLYPLSNKEDSKTKIVHPAYDSFSFLSIRFDGKELWVHESKLTNLREKIRIVTDTNQYPDLITILVKTRNLIEGWLAAFKFVNIERHIEDIDNYIDEKLVLAFRNFDFQLRPTSIRKIKNYKGNMVEVLTKKQRGSTGIKLCKTFLDSIDRKKI